ncbi:SDR family oxidoreductase, partial [Bacillus sp. S34]|nr:SDR family oxidoreductase [Bacillus sp. S34]
MSGAAQGIGRGVAVAFAKAGAAVALLDLNEADLAATSEEIADAGGRSISIGCDVSDRLQVRSAVQRTAEELAAAT